jgi:hypothetical protein
MFAQMPESLLANTFVVVAAAEHTYAKVKCGRRWLAFLQVRRKFSK